MAQEGRVHRLSLQPHASVNVRVVCRSQQSADGWRMDGGTPHLFKVIIIQQAAVIKQPLQGVCCLRDLRALLRLTAQDEVHLVLQDQLVEGFYLGCCGAVCDWPGHYLVGSCT